MDSVEKAIRGTFEKGDPTDRAFRERVYRQVLAALDRALAANPSISPEMAARRRENLKGTIVRVEREFLPARPAEPIAERPMPGDRPDSSPAGVAADAEPVPAPDARIDSLPASGARSPLPTARASQAEAEDAPTIGSARRDNGTFSALRDDPGFLGGAFPEGEGPVVVDAADSIDMDNVRDAGSERRPRRRRRGFAIAFIAATLLAAIGIGIWWAGSTGLFQSAEERDTSVPNPPRELDSEDFAPEGNADSNGQPSPFVEEDTQEREWTTLFSPAEPAEIVAPSDAIAEIADDDGEAFLRLRTGESGNAVTFDIGRGMLEHLAGRTAVFSITARSEPDNSTQMAVSCSLGTLGECGRKRYLVTQERADYLFELELPAGQPDTRGTISIISDVEGNGRSLEIFEIRVAGQ